MKIKWHLFGPTSGIPKHQLGENDLFDENRALWSRKSCFTDFKRAFSEQKMAIVYFKTRHVLLVIEPFVFCRSSQELPGVNVRVLVTWDCVWDDKGFCIREYSSTSVFIKKSHFSSLSVLTWCSCCEKWYLACYIKNMRRVCGTQQ